MHHTGKEQRQSHLEGQVSGPIVAVSRKSLSYHLHRRLGSTQVWSGCGDEVCVPAETWNSIHLYC
jgi:hypothetical protein